MAGKFIEESVCVDGNYFQVIVCKQVSLGVEHPRLVIVSYLPTQESAKLLIIAVETIRKYTNTPYELWVVDNASPSEHLKWLLEQEDINIVLNNIPPTSTNPEHQGSYANGVALEIAKQLVDTKTRYFMTLHQDIAVCYVGWLGYLVGKINGDVKAAGVRMDTTRVESGVLHVLGYIVDFQVIHKTNLTFLPKLPALDTGDSVIVGLKQLGYKVFGTPNTIWESHLIEKIKDDSPLKHFAVDRSFDESGNIIFLHLGRGVGKSFGNYDTPHKVNVNEWYDFIKRYYL